MTHCRCEKKTQDKCRDHCKCKRKCEKKCCVKSSIAVAESANPTVTRYENKNVLIIGASKGMGNGAAQVFTAAGANVLGTSRAPGDYVGQPWLSPVPIDMTEDASVQNFFDTEPTLAAWDHIDFFLLSGVTLPFGYLAYSKASDLYPMINTELLGRHRVVSRAIAKMKDVDDSKIVTISSIASIFPLVGISSYNLVKSALNMWVTTWNAERLLLKEVTGTDVIKTKAVALQPSYVDTTIGALAEGLCNPLAPVPRAFYGQYASGIALGEPTLQGSFGWLGNSGADGTGLNILQMGYKILYIAAQSDPEWQYVAERDGEKVCTSNENDTLRCQLRQAGQHKNKDVITKYFEDYNWKLAYEDILGPNINKYGASVCPPDEPAPPLPAPTFLPGFPDCNGGPTGIPRNIVTQARVDDLVNNPCKEDNPC